MSQTDKKVPEVGMPSLSASDLFNDLQHRCEQLRSWHAQADGQIKEKMAELGERESALDDRDNRLKEHSEELRKHHKKVQHARSRLKEDMDKMRDDREEHEHEKQMVTNKRMELEEDRKELRQIRKELDKEWQTLKIMRKAQEDMAATLDADRQRISEMQLKLVSHKYGDDSQSDYRKLAA
ncbi:Chromosome partition protein Smc [Poriferisphaera corsica]|uniref:Chromosome partition protein Smc n=1 Tax=Poriferisphaera corsica TaxID=2528020 RepID=A0A517YWN0_9BACT|nr:hypothetical protein [Poriferisphaera corsica]QDU34633.1 Chromosome partition protein Smc [Poriferisphaera corsica]